MAQVLGVGGVFFKAADTDAVKAWYVRVLNFKLTDWGGMFFPPLPVGGTTWNPFPAKTDYFKPSTAPFMVNFVVDDLDGLLRHVRSEGVEVLGEEDMHDIGRFAWILDPAGVKIELWQPAPKPKQA